MRPIIFTIVGLGLALSLWDLFRSPVTRRIATRSMARRPAEAMLVIVGAMFGTAIIGAAFIVGDSFNGSVRDVARRELGPVDIVVGIHPNTDVRREVLQLEDLLSHSGLEHVDGLLPAVTSGAVLDNGQRGVRQKILPNNCVAEFDLAQARRFGGDPLIGGLQTAGSTPAEGSALISKDTAQRLGVTAGDTFSIHLFGTTIRQRVRAVLPTVGLAGYCAALVAPGTIETARAQAAPGATGPPTGELLVSLDGGVFDSTAPTASVESAIRVAIKGGRFSAASVQPVKLDRLKRAEQRGDNLRTIFSGVGGFSVISGILLLINLIVMLAEERKVELGVLRAVGLKRRHLVRSFSLEGSLYAAAAAVLGAAVAVGIGSLVIFGTQKIFADPNRRFQTTLFVVPSTLLLSAGVGYAISMVTIWLASVRIARLNIIAAVRDLPEPRHPDHHVLAFAIATIGTIGGIALSVAGWQSSLQIPLLAGVPVACFALIAPTAKLIPRMASSVIWSNVAAGWILAVFSLFPDTMQHAGIEVFVTMGVLLVASAVVTSVALAPLVGRWTMSIRGDWGLSGRLGFAYPLAHAVRTGLLLAMFSLVIFTMTFMASLAATIDGQQVGGARDVAAGYDLLVDSSASNPVTAAMLTSRPEVAGVSTFTQAGPEFTIRYQPSFTRWGVSGFDRSLLAHGTPRLSDRAADFPTDQAAFEAVLADPSLIIVDDQFLLRGGGPKTDGPKVGDRVTIRNDARTTRTLRVAGVLSADFTGLGSLWPASAVEAFSGPQVSHAKSYVRLAPGVDPAAATRSLAAQFATAGAEVQQFTTVVATQLDDTTSFMRLLEVYLAFGLLIGIAGLGVVMVRAARERRREIAMLRAMGTSARVIYRSFLIEAGFISGLGAIIGVTLALVTAYQVVVNSSAFSLSSDSFSIPWLPIALIALVPTCASVLASMQPARTASRVRPAVALRVTD